MPYVIAEPCVDTKNGACVEVCPVDCIRSADDEPQFYIDPDICIECEQCALVCPVNAVFLHTDVPPEWFGYIERNADFYLRTKAAPEPVSIHAAKEMVRAAHTKAGELGIKVTAAVVDPDGHLIAMGRMDDAWPLSLDLAINKAFTAATLQLPTHQLQNIPTQRWFRSFVIANQGRIVPDGGGMPILQATQIIGAVGVSGGTADQERQCCRAAAAVMFED